MAEKSAAGPKSSLLDEEREKLHQAMLSSVSHDLKTPLASIIGSLEIYERMHERLASEKKDALINTALNEAYRLDNFITNILDMAKLENGMVKPKHAEVNLPILLRDCMIKLAHREGSEHVQLPHAYPVETIEGDATLLARALFIVLDNALKHGDVPIVLSLLPDDATGMLMINIRDHGVGIPPEREEEVFSKYTRFSRKDQQNAGTGLGLSIARAIMRLLGGDIEAINHAGGGSVFTLRVPMKQ